MGLAGLFSSDMTLIMFGGKGGVGKTCSASAAAIALAKNSNTLIISTDPAHSLSDCFQQQIGKGIHPITGVENLSATEISAEHEYTEFIRMHKKELMELFDTSTGLDEEDAENLLKLSIPGIDEIMSFKTIVDYIESGSYAKYVVDMAPSGHALRLISSPAILDQWIKTAAGMRWKYRYMVTRFSGSYQQDGADALLLNLKKTVKKIEKLFRDYTRSEFIPVCIPEAMSEAETGRLIASLGSFGITVKQLIINNVMEPAGDCIFCMERKKGQEKYIARIEKTYPEVNKVQVPLFAHEVCGLGRLNEVSRYLFSPEKDNRQNFKSESDRIAGKD